MYYRRTPEGYFVCCHCGEFLDDHLTEPDKLVHSSIKKTDFFYWTKEEPSKCEFAGRKVYNPDVFSG